MKLHAQFLALGSLAFSLAVASEPGQPLDCSDWFPAENGLACSELGAEPPGDAVPVFTEGSTSIDFALSVEGEVLWANGNDSGTANTCPGASGGITIYRRVGPGNQDRVVGSLRGRCVGLSPEGHGILDGIRPYDRAIVGGGGSFGAFLYRTRLLFDAVHGRLIIPVQNTCNHDANGNVQPGGSCTAYPSKTWYLVISGFTQLFDILKTYEPGSTSLSFRNPAHPFGLRSVDHFDSYTGDLATLGDFTQAQPLQCNYPAIPPRVGDYLTVNDALPNPAIGTGRYYVTAATYQGQTRYGRRRTRGHLTGRDPALLPACNQP